MRKEFGNQAKGTNAQIIPTQHLHKGVYILKVTASTNKGDIIINQKKFIKVQ